MLQSRLCWPRTSLSTEVRTRRDSAHSSFSALHWSPTSSHLSYTARAGACSRPCQMHVVQPHDPKLHSYPGIDSAVFCLHVYLDIARKEHKVLVTM